MPLVTVQGHAVRHVPAERGTVHVRIKATADDTRSPRERADSAFGAVASLAASAVADGAATWWGADGVVTWSATQWHKPSAHVDGVYLDRHHAAASIDVKFSDVPRLHAFVLDVHQVPDARVHRVEWTLTEATRRDALRATRTGAALDARSRAEAYAGALGLSEVAIVHLYDEGLRPGLARGAAETGVGARNGVGSGGDTGDLALHPDQISVTTVVTADFEVR
ncbi:uncharacterized protein DUF541 [Sediminihabitans luteus]|uniref:Uncharacterized protein DUF541 n=1 Tax=Sediminihabitans luteus TaxID=1138585 RepID=A0A2M9CPZ1_9CELL|nr:SIMPL domain-containing protein [Sediminihabitans luteus]PJJ73986.1 uncharacterized protein DUF541 [Sediminihabitans luteus]GII98101.1 hypothetical protein Slu03_04790 [Sediminihabitans luteus]